MRVFALMKEVRYGISGDNFLGGKDIIYQYVTSMFSWTFTIQIFQSQIGSLPELILVRVIIELWYLIDLCLDIFNVTLMSKTVLFL